MCITAKSIAPLVFAAKIDLPVCNPLDVKQVTYRYVVGGEIFPA
jgi:hypothetical protein